MFITLVRDDTTMGRRLRVAVLIAAAVMFGATFAPFAHQGCLRCPASLDGTPIVFPSLSTFQGLDGWIVLGIVVALILSATASLIRKRAIAATACLVVSVAALALGIFEAVNEGGRVIGWDAAGPPMELGPHGPVPSVSTHVLSPPVYLDAGFVLFVAGALVAVIAAAAVVLMVRRAGTD